ncbi:hypothetical protein TYRP_009822 [Tyrophagus putrescentiae]|nr:hypothetical protein TYRP_009822 [Tyrophagus putrescentiae]
MAYRDWLCSTLIPYYLKPGGAQEVTSPVRASASRSSRVPPPASLRQGTVRRGEPVFLCIDAKHSLQRADHTEHAVRRAGQVLRPLRPGEVPK